MSQSCVNENRAVATERSSECGCAGMGKNIKLKSNTNNGINPKLVILLVEIKSVKSLAVFCRSFILAQNKCCNNAMRYAL